MYASYVRMLRMLVMMLAHILRMSTAMYVRTQLCTIKHTIRTPFHKGVISPILLVYGHLANTCYIATVSHIVSMFTNLVAPVLLVVSSIFKI